MCKNVLQDYIQPIKSFCLNALAILHLEKQNIISRTFVLWFSEWVIFYLSKEAFI